MPIGSPGSPVFIAGLGGPRPMAGFSLPFSQPASYVISGVTKSSSGAVLGYCTVDIFETQTRLFRATTTSDSSGNYRVGVTSPETGLTFFAVAYKAGLPDLAGTSVNTLNADTSSVPIAAGASIQTAINANPPGTRFSLAAGTWNNEVISPKIGNQFIGAAGGGTILHGNDITLALYGSAGTPDLNVLMENIQVTHYGDSDAAEFRLGAIHGAWGWTFKNMLFDFNNGTGLNMARSTIINSRLNDNRHRGIVVYYNDLVIGCEIARNNSRGDDPYDDAAGLKGGFNGAVGNNIRLLYNYVHDNAAPGLWLDYASGGNTIRGNTVIGNDKAGIMVEVTPPTGAFSTGVTEISHNVVNNNTETGIFVSTCANVQVNNNNIKVPAGVHFGILAQNQVRTLDPDFENNTALNNVITFSDSSNSSGARDDGLAVHGTGNTIDYTTYYGATANNHWFWFSSPTNFAAYKAATGQDANSTCTMGDGSVAGFLDIGGSSDPC